MKRDYREELLETYSLQLPQHQMRLTRTLNAFPIGSWLNEKPLLRGPRRPSEQKGPLYTYCATLSLWNDALVRDGDKKRGRICYVTFAAYFNILSWHSPGEAEDNHEERK